MKIHQFKEVLRLLVCLQMIVMRKMYYFNQKTNNQEYNLSIYMIKLNEIQSG